MQKSLSDFAPSVLPAEGVGSTKVSDDSIDEGPEEIVMIHVPDMDIFTSQEVKGVQPPKGILPIQIQ